MNELMAEKPFAVANIICSLQKCRKKQSLEYAKHVHAQISIDKMDTYSIVENHIVPMFSECGSISTAQQSFGTLVHRNEYSWTSLILGYINYGQSYHAFNMYQKMQEDCILASSFTFKALLKACAMIIDIDRGRQFHAEIRKGGCDQDLFVGSSLVDMYVKCGSLAEAQKVFDKLLLRDTVSWTAIIAGYVEYQCGSEALKCFEQMKSEGISPDSVTYISCLKACGSVGALDKGRELHKEIVQKVLQENYIIGNTLIDMYSKCGSLIEAQQVFDKLSFQDVVSWTLIIAAYAEHEYGEEALRCFEQMQSKDVSPDLVTFIWILKACGSIGAMDKARDIHFKIKQNGLDRDLRVGPTLVDMYSRGGALVEAHKVFVNLPVRNIVSWNAIIRGYGINHESDMAIQCFKEMQEHKVKPSAITFTCLLSACSRASLVFKGLEYFKVMTEDYGITPLADHYICVVDLLGRAGHLYEAEKFLALAPGFPPEDAWKALLSACKTYGEIYLGSWGFQHLIQKNPEDAISYVLMANIYGNASNCNASSNNCCS